MRRRLPKTPRRLNPLFKIAIDTHRALVRSDGGRRRNADRRVRRRRAPGSVAASRITAHVRPLRLAVIGKLLQAIIFATLILALPLWGAVVVMAGLGVANGLTNGPAAAVRIGRLSPRHPGNALTAAATVTMAGGAIGSAAAGPALDHIRVQGLFAAVTLLLAASCLLYLRGARASTTQNNTELQPTGR